MSNDYTPEFKSELWPVGVRSAAFEPVLVTPKRHGTCVKNLGKIPLEFTTRLYKKLFNLFARIERPLYQVDLSRFKIEERGSILDFLTAVEAYAESGGLMDWRKILFFCLSPTARKRLKKFRQATFLANIRGVTYEVDDIDPTIPFPFPLLIEDIGEIFNYRYALLWKEKDPEDYKLGLEALPIDQEILEDFQVTFTGLIEDLTLTEVFVEEIQLEHRSSVVLVDGKPTKGYLSKTKKITPSRVRHPVLRTLIPTDSGSRDSVINEAADLVTIQLINKYAEQLVQQLPYSVPKNLVKFEQIYARFTKSHNSFYCRDFEKEGITRSFQVTTALLKGLKECFPEEFEFVDETFYDRLDLIIGDEIISMKRGSGLGMANSLVTLMQFTIHEMTLKRYPFDSSEINLLALNDDMVMGCNDSEEMETYIEIDMNLCQALGLNLKKSKSFRSERGCVFLETYYKELNESFNLKMSYRYRFAYLAFRMPNIAAAKCLISSIDDIGHLVTIFPKIVKFWGYEFFRDEHRYPFEFGGWFRFSVIGVNLCLKVAETLEYDEFVCRAWYASQINRPSYSRGPNGLFKNSFLKMFRIREEFEPFFDILPFRDLDRKMGRLINQPELYLRAMEDLYIERRVAFEKAPIHSFKTLAELIIVNHKGLILPCDFMISHEATGDFSKIVDDRFYETDHPLLGALLADNPFSYLKNKVFKDEYTILLKDYTQSNISLLLPEYRSLEVFTSLASFEYETTLEVQYPLDPGDFQEYWDSYLYPSRIALAYKALGYYGCRILKPEYRQEIIRKRNSVFTKNYTRDIFEYSKEFDRHLTYIYMKTADDAVWDIMIDKLFPPEILSESKSFSETEDEGPRVPFTYDTEKATEISLNFSQLLERIRGEFPEEQLPEIFTEPPEEKSPEEVIIEEPQEVIVDELVDSVEDSSISGEDIDPNSNVLSTEGLTSLRQMFHIDASEELNFSDLNRFKVFVRTRYSDVYEESVIEEALINYENYLEQYSASTEETPPDMDQFDFF